MAEWNNVLKENDFQYLNVTKIFPTQQRDVATILNNWSKNATVKKVVVFGSSVTSACNPWSDIDIYVELDKDEVIRAPKVGVPVDVFTNFEVDTRLYNEIERTGVVVYER